MTVHEPVLLAEVLRLLDVKRGGCVIDSTVGGGGHTQALLERIGPEGRLLGLDRDEEAIERTRARLRSAGLRAVLAHGNFAAIAAIARQAGFDQVDAVIMDLGFSSDQLAPERGFSFTHDGPLDGRMDRSSGRTTADLVNGLAEAELRDLFRDLGQERAAQRIARAIVKEREKAPIQTTGRLAAVVERAVGGRRGRLHPATAVMRALRMRVNDELESLESGLEGALSLLGAGGRLGAISFSSLEDTIVKRCFARHAGRWESLQAGGREWRGAAPAVRWVNRKPVTPSAAEVARNPRARSAKLRVAERADPPER
jgi:16S rRNA (cytosine1402-N4)-methyltransferase